MAQFGDKNKVTLWGRLKEKKSRAGDTYEAYEGSVDLGGGKMLTILMYADQQPVEGKDGKMIFPFQVRKWKGTPRSTNKNKSW